MCQNINQRKHAFWYQEILDAKTQEEYLGIILDPIKKYKINEKNELCNKL